MVEWHEIVLLAPIASKCLLKIKDFFGSNASHIIEFQFGTRSQNSSAAAAGH